MARHISGSMRIPGAAMTARVWQLAAVLLAASLAVALPGDAQTQAPAAQDTFMLTIFLRHDQSKTLDQLQQHLKETGFDQSFPPEGIEIASWYVMMGIGQVVTLRVPPARLTRSQPRDRAEGLGRLPHRLLSDLRLFAGVETGASGAVAVSS
jgi:hypothetical protein